MSKLEEQQRQSEVKTARAGCFATFPVANYNLSATLASGQCFRWSESAGTWSGVIRGRSVRLRQGNERIDAEAATPQASWEWLADYLQVDAPFMRILETFPTDPPMSRALRSCSGLRLLRQEPWECLASFILSSSKQIVQIERVVEMLSERYGQAIEGFPDRPGAHAFPLPEVIAEAPERELRRCKMGFRAPYLKETARAIASRRVNLDALARLPLESARAALLELPGVGRKVADCVLLFAYDFPGSFPVDVWVARALRSLYFQGRPMTLPALAEFSSRHFGPYSGYAQQYLFHYMRTRGTRAA